MEMIGTTILAVLRDGHLAIAGDGQVTMGNQIVKGHAHKVRRLYHGKILGGFAGHTADAITLFERFEAKLEGASGNLKKAAVDLAKEWRTDRVLRRLEAMLLVGNNEEILVISGQGDVLEPDESMTSIGSGAPMAISAARALLRHTQLSAEDIARISLGITAESCIYTNTSIQVETL
ncbi:MAG: ATP-dependent protease subunit HslV [Candidatus Riflebacteria bacterium]|nr:ATP-dependent protease subunit HslV [Candidatus Riflebacteria bacterium]